MNNEWQKGLTLSRALLVPFLLGGISAGIGATDYIAENIFDSDIVDGTVDLESKMEHATSGKLSLQNITALIGLSSLYALLLGRVKGKSRRPFLLTSGVCGALFAFDELYLLYQSELGLSTANAMFWGGLGTSATAKSIEMTRRIAKNGTS